jgi:MFS family permease
VPGGDEAPGAKALGGLWRRTDFLKLWLAQSLSRAGSEVSRVALPLTAVVLSATPVQMGLLRAASSAPDFVLGLMVGAWVDRTPRRGLLIATGLVRALLLATIPTAAALHVLRLEHLFVVALLAGSLALAADVAQRAYLPQLVHPDDIVDANSRLTASGAGASLAGPAAGGALSALLTAPVALGVDSASLFAAAAGLWTIRSDDSAVVADRGRRGLRGLATYMTEGIRFMVADRRLRALAASAGLFNLFDGVIFAVYVLYATRALGITQVSLGLIFAAGGAGALAGTVLAGRITRKLGLGPALVAAVLVAVAGEVVIHSRWDRLQPLRSCSPAQR